MYETPGRTHTTNTYTRAEKKSDHKSKMYEFNVRRNL